MFVFCAKMSSAKKYFCSKRAHSCKFTEAVVQQVGSYVIKMTGMLAVLQVAEHTVLIRQLCRQPRTIPQRADLHYCLLQQQAEECMLLAVCWQAQQEAVMMPQHQVMTRSYSNKQTGCIGEREPEWKLHRCQSAWPCSRPSAVPASWDLHSKTE